MCAAIFLLGGWHAHSAWSLVVALCIAVGACFPAWWFWQRREAIAGNYARSERVPEWRMRAAAPKLFQDEKK